MDQKKIGEFIKNRRKELGLTQKQLAEKMDISDKTISKYECGNGLPDVSMLKPLCDILEVNINELLSGEKVSSEEYTEKAEENMMHLLKENETERHSWKIGFTIGIILSLIGIVMTIVGATLENESTSALVLLDLNTLIILAILILAGVLISGAHGKKDVVCVIQKISIPAGAFMTLAHIIMILSIDVEQKVTNVNLSVCLLSLMYAVALHMVLVPVIRRIK